MLACMSFAHAHTLTNNIIMRAHAQMHTCTACMHAHMDTHAHTHTP